MLIGVGIGLVAPILLPAAAKLTRPLAKTLIKGYLTLVDDVQQVVAEARQKPEELETEMVAEGEEVLTTVAEKGLEEVAVEAVTELVEGALEVI